MKKLFPLIALVSLVFHISFVGLVRAAGGSPVIFSRVTVSSQADAGDEVVEIYNNTAAAQDIGGLGIEYKSATGTSWSRRAAVAAGTKLDGWHAYRFASVAPGDAKLSPGLAQAGGNLRLTDGAGSVLDQLAWGSGDSALGTAVAAPAAGDSIVRRPVDGSSTQLQDSGNNQTDYSVEQAGSAGADSAAAEGTDSTTSASLDLQLTELLPDPVSPQTDGNDEFIELYNPNQVTVSLAGWKLRDGGGKTYAFKQQTIAPASYFVIYSKEDKLSLNNSGDTVSLLAPDGSESDSSPNYGKAKAGISWGLTEDGWAWLQTPTPGGANSAALTADGQSSSAKSSGKTSKAKAASAKKAASKTSKAKAAAKTGLGSSEDTAATKPLYNIWSWLLIAAGLGTIGYGIYEYRPEIIAYYHKCRAKLSSWRRAS